MRIYHAAALALVVLYLMIPPIRVLGPKNEPNTPIEFDAKAPFSEWRIIQGFDSVKDCYAYPEHLGKMLHDPKNQGVNDAAKDWFDKAECIATDDPRVAGMKPPAN